LLAVAGVIILLSGVVAAYYAIPAIDDIRNHF